MSEKVELSVTPTWEECVAGDIVDKYIEPTAHAISLTEAEWFLLRKRITGEIKKMVTAELDDELARDR